MESRLKAKDFENMLKVAKEKLNVVKTKIRYRAFILCRDFPNIVIREEIFYNGTVISIYSGTLINVINDMNDFEIINVIDIIEKDIEGKHPHKQLEIKFKKEVD